jgi:hypothetical protein
MNLYLLDLLRGGLRLHKVSGESLPCLDALEGVRLGERDQLLRIPFGAPLRTGDLLDPVAHLAGRWQQAGSTAPAFSKALGRMLSDWIQPRLAEGDGLLVLFHPGLPDDARQFMLDELRVSSRLSLVAGGAAALLSLLAPGGNQWITMGLGDWRLRACRGFDQPALGRARHSLGELALLDESPLAGEEATLAGVLRRWAALLEGNGGEGTSEGELELDLQPRLTALAHGGLQDQALVFSVLEPGAEGCAHLSRTQSGYSPDGSLHLGCGRGKHWSGCEPLARLDLGRRPPQELDLTWHVSRSMMLHLEISSPDGHFQQALERQIPRPLIVTLNRLLKAPEDDFGDAPAPPYEEEKPT